MGEKVVPNIEKDAKGADCFKKKKAKKPILVSKIITGVIKAVIVHQNFRIALLATNKELKVATRPITETIWFIKRV